MLNELYDETLILVMPLTVAESTKTNLQRAGAPGTAPDGALARVPARVRSMQPPQRAGAPRCATTTNNAVACVQYWATSLTDRAYDESVSVGKTACAPVGQTLFGRYRGFAVGR